MTRLQDKFNALKSESKTAFSAYHMAGDPDKKQSLAFMQALPKAGVDIIELGMPFSDPVADGAVIEAAGQRALAHGIGVQDCLDMVRCFRKTDTQTPIILMGYANPVHFIGYEEFASQAAQVGVDGAIIVDLPLEEEAPLRIAMQKHNMVLIRLLTPTTSLARMHKLVRDAQGFIYYVSVSGVTGRKVGALSDISQAFNDIRAISDLPLALGFGIKTPAQAKTMAAQADVVVVGSVIVDALYQHGADQALVLVRSLAKAIKE